MTIKQASLGAFISLGDCDPPLRGESCSFNPTAYRSGVLPLLRLNRMTEQEKRGLLCRIDNYFENRNCIIVYNYL